MGQSTDAFLFFGFSLGEDTESLSDWEKKYAAKKGVQEPTEEYDDFDPVVVDKYNAYWDRCRELVDLEPCTIAFHCSGDYPIYYVAIKRTVSRASRGYPKEINPAELADNCGERQALLAFCELMDIPPQSPKWWLASRWF